MSVVVMSRWISLKGRELPAIGERVLVSDGIDVFPGRMGPDRHWYLAAPGRPVLLRNYLFGLPDTWYWMKMPAPPGRT